MKNVMIGGLATLISVGVYLIYNNSQAQQVLQRQIVLNIAKRIKQDMYTVLFDISSFVQLNAQNCSPEQLRANILSSQSTLYQSLKEKLTQIYEEYGTSQSQFQDQITNYYKNDKQIQYHITKYTEEFEKALLGMQPQFKENAITFMSKQKILIIVEKLLSDKLSRIKQKIQSARNIKQFERAIQLDKKQDLRNKLKILKEIGLVSNEAEAMKIFEFCVGKYMRMSNQFKQKYYSITSGYQQNIKKTLEDKIKQITKESQ